MSCRCTVRDNVARLSAIAHRSTRDHRSTHLLDLHARRISRLRGRRVPERRDRVCEGLRHGVARARRADHARHRVLRRISVEAVHRDGRGAGDSAGELSYDDSIRKHLPELPAYADTIKVSHLLHHTSGLRDYNTLLAVADGGTRMRGTTRPSSDDRAPEGAQLRSGRRYLYSNTGYTLLATIVERATGTKFAALRRRADLQAARHDRVAFSHRRAPAGEAPRARLRRCAKAPGRWIRRSTSGPVPAASTRNRRPLEVGRELLQRQGRRAPLLKTAADARRAQRRQDHRVCVGPADRRIRRPADRRALGLARRLPRPPLSRAVGAHLGGAPVQCLRGQHQHAGAPRRERRLKRSHDRARSGAGAAWPAARRAACRTRQPPRPTATTRARSTATSSTSASRSRRAATNCSCNGRTTPRRP